MTDLQIVTEPDPHAVDLGKIPRPHLGPLYKPSCTCGAKSPARPTPDVEDAKKWRREHLANAAHNDRQRSSADTRNEGTTTTTKKDHR